MQGPEESEISIYKQIAKRYAAELFHFLRDAILLHCFLFSIRRRFAIPKSHSPSSTKAVTFPMPNYGFMENFFYIKGQISIT